MDPGIPRRDDALSRGPPDLSLRPQTERTDHIRKECEYFKSKRHLKHLRRHLFRLSEVCSRSPGVSAIHHRARFHAAGTLGRIRHSGFAHHSGAIRAGGFGVRVQRRGVGAARGGFCGSLRPQETAAGLLLRLHLRHPAVRPGIQLRHAAAGQDDHGHVRRRGGLDLLCHCYRPVCVSNARPRHGRDPHPSPPAACWGCRWPC